MQSFPPVRSSKAHHMTCKYLPTINNGLLMPNVVHLYLAAKNFLLMHK